MTLRVAVELDAAHPDFFGIGEIAAQHADVGVHDLGLEVLDVRVEEREVRGRAANTALSSPPNSTWRTSSGLTVAADSTGRPGHRWATPFRLSPTDLKPVAYVA